MIYSDHVSFTPILLNETYKCRKVCLCFVFILKIKLLEDEKKKEKEYLIAKLFK